MATESHIDVASKTTDFLGFNYRREHKMLGIMKGITNLTLLSANTSAYGESVYLFFFFF